MPALKQMENAEAASDDCSLSEQSKQRTEQSFVYFSKLTKWQLNVLWFFLRLPYWTSCGRLGRTNGCLSATDFPILTPTHSKTRSKKATLWRQPRHSEMYHSYMARILMTQHLHKHSFIHTHTHRKYWLRDKTGSKDWKDVGKSQTENKFNSQF